MSSGHANRPAVCVTGSEGGPKCSVLASLSSVAAILVPEACSSAADWINCKIRETSRKINPGSFTVTRLCDYLQVEHTGLTGTEAW